MDKYFIRYNPTFFVSPVQLVKYLSFETRFKAEYLCGQKTISNPELYFQYYLDKMEAIRLEKFLGNIDGPSEIHLWGTKFKIRNYKVLFILII